MSFYPIEDESRLFDGYIQAHQVGELNLLLIQQNGQRFLIENRCGHFGIPLDKGKVENQCITCPQHGIRFNLTTGLVDSKTRDSCEPIKVFSLISTQGSVGLEI